MQEQLKIKKRLDNYINSLYVINVKARKLVKRFSYLYFAKYGEGNIWRVKNGVGEFAFLDDGKTFGTFKWLPVPQNKKQSQLESLKESDWEEVPSYQLKSINDSFCKGIPWEGFKNIPQDNFDHFAEEDEEF